MTKSKTKVFYETETNFMDLRGKRSHNFWTLSNENGQCGRRGGTPFPFGIYTSHIWEFQL